MSLRTHVSKQPSLRRMDRVLETGKAILEREVLVTGVIYPRSRQDLGVSLENSEIQQKYVSDHTRNVLMQHENQILGDMYAISSHGYLNNESITDLTQYTPLLDTGAFLSSTLTLRMSALQQWDASVQVVITGADRHEWLCQHAIKIDLREFDSVIEQIIWFAQTLGVTDETFDNWTRIQETRKFRELLHQKNGILISNSEQLKGYVSFFKDRAERKFEEWKSHTGIADLFRHLEINTFEDLPKIFNVPHFEPHRYPTYPPLKYVLECASAISIFGKAYSEFIYEDLTEFLFRPGGLGAQHAEATFVNNLPPSGP